MPNNLIISECPSQDPAVQQLWETVYGPSAGRSPVPPGPNSSVASNPPSGVVRPWGNGEYDVLAPQNPLACPTDGVTDATLSIDQAGIAAFNAGGGTVLLPYLANGYVLKRRVVGKQNQGGIFVRPGVSYQGQNTKLLLRDNCAWFATPFDTFTTVATITASVAFGDTQVQVDSSAGFAVGNWGYIKLVDDPNNAGESQLHFFAKVSAIADGTHLTFDRPINIAMTVGSTSTSGRKVTLVSSLVENIEINSFQLIDGNANGGNAEGGIQAVYSRNLHFQNITATDPGAGAIVAQFSENIEGTNIRVLSSVKQSGAASKGRIFSFAECDNVTIDGFEGENFEGPAVFTEAYSRSIKLRNGNLVNNFVGRVAGTAIFFNSNSDMTVEDLRLSGNGSYVLSDTGSSSGVTRFKGVSLLTGRPTGVSPWQIEGWLRIAPWPTDGINGDWCDVKRFSKSFRILPSQAGQTITTPSGLYRRLKIYVSTKTGLTGTYLYNLPAATGDITASLTAGALADLTSQLTIGINGAYNARQAGPRALTLTTDGTVPADAVGRIEIDYFVPNTMVAAVATDGSEVDDLSLGFMHDDSSLVRTQVLKVLGPLERSRQTPTEAVLVSGVDATAGEIVSVTLSAARVVGAPLNPAIGQRLVFNLIQNGTGGWAVTWNAVFKVSWADTGNTLNKRSSIAFLYDGTNWNQDGAQTPYV